MPAKTHYIYSTLSASQVYTRTIQGGGDMPVTVAEVYIKGGSNIADKYAETYIGEVTEVSDEELTVLLENDVFGLHLKNGFIRVEEIKADPEKVAADMSTRDQSAPLVDADFEAEGAPAPIVAEATKPKNRRA